MKTQKIARCYELLAEVFDVNNIDGSIAIDAMFNLIVGINIAKKRSYETFRKAILKALEDSEKNWKSNH